MSTDTPQYGENAGGFGIRHFLLARRPAEEGEWYSLINAIPLRDRIPFSAAQGFRLTPLRKLAGRGPATDAHHVPSAIRLARLKKPTAHTVLFAN